MRGLVILLAACGPAGPTVAHRPTSRQCPTTDSCEAVRISGDIDITPDEVTLGAMRDANVHAIRNLTRLCIGTDGSVVSVDMIVSSGFPRYDNDVEAAMRKWRYEPFMVKGTAQEVCTMMTMVWKPH